VGAAIDAYTEHLRKLTTWDFRDKKTYDWILEAFEKTTPEGKPDYQAFRQSVRAKLPRPKAKADPISTWRLHLLLSRVAGKQGNEPEARQELQLAITTYPDVAYPEQETQSRLQHLYNEAALARAKEDPVAGEEILVQGFLKDPRFLYVYLPPWKEFYASINTPEKYDALIQRIIAACDQKAQRFPAHSDALTHYRRLYAEELAAKPAPTS